MKTVLELVMVTFDSTGDPKSQEFMSIMSKVILTHYRKLSKEDTKALWVQLEEWECFIDFEAVQSLFPIPIVIHT